MSESGDSAQSSERVPMIDDAVDAELRDFVARRKSELPDTFA